MKKTLLHRLQIRNSNETNVLEKKRIIPKYFLRQNEKIEPVKSSTKD